VDELHDRIAAYLRGQRQSAKHGAPILAIWRERCLVPHCRYCGTPIDDRDGFFLVEELLLARACAAHHNRY